MLKDVASLAKNVLDMHMQLEYIKKDQATASAHFGGQISVNGYQIASNVVMSI